MASPADRLPDRFPVGTRYVVEGHGARRGHLRVRSRYLEFPDGRHVDLPIGRPVQTRSRRGRSSSRRGFRK